MDSATFEQFSLAKNQLDKTADFLKEGGEVDIVYFDDKPININLPIKMTFEITYTEPGYKGNTATNVLKPATLETGAQIDVPLFIKVGDKIIIDTRTGQYVERESNK
jgi:elongation factor P